MSYTGGNGQMNFRRELEARLIQYGGNSWTVSKSRHKQILQAHAPWNYIEILQRKIQTWLVKKYTSGNNIGKC